MREPDSLEALLREEWKSPEPSAALDQRVISAYRTAVRPSAWRLFWRLRISVPVPVLLAAGVAALGLFFWFRPAAAPGSLTGNNRRCDPIERNGISTVTQWRCAGRPGSGGQEMKRSAFVVWFVATLAVVLRAGSQHILHASFPDGAGLEIFTETTGSSDISSQGSMGIGPGTGSQDLVNRVVTDQAGNILFAYNLEASHGTSPSTVMIRIEPISAASEAGILKYEASKGRHFPGAHLPTVAGVREFPAVKIGEAVTLDILYNPSTGEKIFDVLRPIVTPPSAMSVTVVPAAETISLKEIAIRVNGRPMRAPASWKIGPAVRIDIPRRGTYVLAAYDPQGASPDHVFAAVAHADGKMLSWVMGGDRVEITSSTNVLRQSGKGVLWVYHDPHYQPDVVELESADTVEWLLPKR